ncbi:MAG: hypothetical protein IJ729_06765, partial [Alloprevotella sp.]|nr:hypothetical protein [Alloprevotella sp.]
MQTLQTITYAGAQAEVFTFDNGTEVTEHHVMLHLTDPAQDFSQQLVALLNAYDSLRDQLGGPAAVFKRYFVSDAANQADAILAADAPGCALSIIQQPTLDGTKLALWAYMQTGVLPQATSGGLYEVRHGGFRHLWGGSAAIPAEGSEAQTSLLINQYVMQ